MAFEGLNNLGHSGKKAIIVLNDNGRSYAPTVSKLGDSLARLRLNPTYLRNRSRLDRILHEVPVVGHQLEKSVDGFVAAMREMFEPPAFFENLGVRYTGPFDGHDIEGMEKALRWAAEYDGPIVVHVLTQKGRGPRAGRERRGQAPPRPRASGLKPGSYTAAFSEAMIKEAEARPELVAITAAMPDSTGLLPFGERFPGRLIDVGIAEQHAVTSAAGMAMGGLRPVVAIYATFLTRAIDQVVYDVGLHEQPVVFCLDRAGITGDDGASHHGVLDMALVTKVPGMTLFAPSSYQELGVMLHDALDLCTGPAAIRWSKTAAPSVRRRRGRLRALGSQGPRRPRRVHPRRRQDARRRPGGRRGAGRRRHRGHRVGRAGGPARPRDARRRRRAPDRAHRRGRHPRRRRRLAHRRRPLPPRRAVAQGPRARHAHASSSSTASPTRSSPTSASTPTAWPARPAPSSPPSAPSGPGTSGARRASNAACDDSLALARCSRRWCSSACSDDGGTDVRGGRRRRPSAPRQADLVRRDWRIDAVTDADGRAARGRPGLRRGPALRRRGRLQRQDLQPHRRRRGDQRRRRWSGATRSSSTRHGVPGRGPHLARDHDGRPLLRHVDLGAQPTGPFASRATA